MGLSPKGIRSKRTARGGARANGDDNVKNGDGLKKGQSESTDGEIETGSTRKRKPNSLMNPEEGYSFKTSSSSRKKVHEKELGGSSLVKLAAKKASEPSKVGQTNQSVVISLSPSSKAGKGSRKRSRSKMEETDLDAGSLATPASKKQIVKKDDPEEKEDFMKTNLEKPEESTKLASKKEKAQKGSAKTTAKKPLAESKKEKAQEGSAKTIAKKLLAESKKEKTQKGSAITAAKKPLVESKKETEQNGLAKTSAKKRLDESVHSDSKKKNSKGASMDMQTPESSKNKVLEP